MKNLRVISRFSCLAGFAVVLPISALGASCKEFDEISMILERNATDGDAEIVLVVEADEIGLVSLTISDPRGRNLANLMVGGVGAREFIIESPEPKDSTQLLETYSEGDYTFRALASDGSCLSGVAKLSHVSARQSLIIAPQDDVIVSASELSIRWTPVAEAVMYLVQIEEASSGRESSFSLPPSVHGLKIPSHWLTLGAQYQVAVGIEVATGNQTFVEQHFSVHGDPP